ncbi:hypothetical protein [Paenibacillus andongensis]|uniref:hypothetical protein n=1 Tax=Paenibacillus andongensis TaxID=2975482 RepID=UPI0021BADE7D|nr:hypothetical protein [Paenibacillus andongensis]
MSRGDFKVIMLAERRYLILLETAYFPFSRNEEPLFSRFRAIKAEKHQYNATTFRVPAPYWHNRRNSGTSFPAKLD